MDTQPPRVAAVDLFCGAGGLSYGLQAAGISIAAGVDLDPACKYPFEENVGAPFLERDVRELTADELDELWGDDTVRLLAGCAPCQPFSPYRRGQDTSDEAEWSLLTDFARLVRETEPELVTMENVPRVGSAQVFLEFVAALEDAGYHIDRRSCNGVHFGLGQRRRRLVVVASRFGLIDVPHGDPARTPTTVRQLIGDLARLEHGQADSHDPLHCARRLSDTNLARIKASTPGGTWEDWPKGLRAPCHRRATGATFRNVYARMEWDEPAPTITTLSHNFGTGRFGHPEQHRTISLREAAILQGFPPDYRFVEAGERVYFSRLGRLIGNAVPPPLGEAVGAALVAHAAAHAEAV